MAVKLSTQARNAANDAVVDLIDLGSAVSKGYIEIRDGLIPTSPLSEATGKLLAKLELSRPAFKNSADGKALANVINNDIQIDNTGVASWFRIYNRDNIPVIDGTVSVIGGDGDIQFDKVDFFAGGVVAIMSLSVAMPV